MTSSNLTVSKVATGNNALPKFENLVIDDNWRAANDITQNYIEENTARLNTIKNLEIDFDDDTSMSGKGYKDLLYDFAIKFRKGKIDGVE